MASKKVRKILPTEIAQQNTSNNNTPPPDSSALRVVWHLCHLCNVTTSSINVYLSLEALARETWTNGMLYGAHIAYQPAMRAHALMLADVCRNLETDRETLLRSNKHFEYDQHGSYRSLIEAANNIPRIIRMIPQGFSTFADPATADYQCMPSKEVVDQIRNACDYVTELCVGDADKDIVGWKVCWENLVSKSSGD